MKSPVELNSLFSKFFCYHLVCCITLLDTTLGDLQTRPLRQILLFLRNICLAGLKITNCYEYPQISFFQAYIIFFKAELYRKKFLRALDLFCMITHIYKILFFKDFQNYNLPGIMRELE